MNKKIRNRNKALLLLFCFLACIGHASSQIGNNGYFHTAEKIYKAKKYFEAAQAFKRYLWSEQPSRSTGSPFAVEKRFKGMSTLNMHEEAVFSLAECYRNYNDFTQAEKYYAQAAGFKNKAYVLAQLWYGISLRANQKYAEAYEAINRFLENYTEMGPVLLMADKELSDLKFIKSQLARTDSDYLLRQQPVAGNTSVYALSSEKNDTVIFTSVHVDSPTSKKGVTDYNADMYRSVLNGHTLDLTMKVNIPDSQGVHNGLGCFAAGGKDLFFTRWTRKNGQNHSSIFRCEKKDTGWTIPVKVEGDVNVEGYNSTQPFVTEDGKFILFASDRPGGKGNYDLWFASLDSNSQTSDAVNMGDAINTPGDEETPYYHEKTHTLVFSSNGLTGMGGFDIYYARRSFDFTRWDQPKNPGLPINSVKDDQYYISTDAENLWNSGWLSSDRSTDCCLALFSVRQNNSLVVTGKVVECKSRKPIAGAEVTFSDHRHGDTLIGKAYTDSMGQYRQQMKNVSSFHVQAEKSGYDTAMNDLAVELEIGPNMLNAPDLCLALPKEVVIEIKEELKALSRSPTLANFDFKKHALNKAAYPNLDSLIDLMRKNPSIVVEIGGYTDGKGSLALNMRLAQIRVDVCMQYLLKKGLPRARLKTKAYGPCCPVEPETVDGKDNPVARAKNRRVEYKLVE